MTIKITGCGKTVIVSSEFGTIKIDQWQGEMIFKSTTLPNISFIKNSDSGEELQSYSEHEESLFLTNHQDQAISLYDEDRFKLFHMLHQHHNGFSNLVNLNMLEFDIQNGFTGILKRRFTSRPDDYAPLLLLVKKDIDDLIAVIASNAQVFRNLRGNLRPGIYYLPPESPFYAIQIIPLRRKVASFKEVRVRGTNRTQVVMEEAPDRCHMIDLIEDFKSPEGDHQFYTGMRVHLTSLFFIQNQFEMMLKSKEQERKHRFGVYARGDGKCISCADHVTHARWATEKDNA